METTLKNAFLSLSTLLAAAGVAAPAAAEFVLVEDFESFSVGDAGDAKEGVFRSGAGRPEVVEAIDGKALRVSGGGPGTGQSNVSFEALRVPEGARATVFLQFQLGEGPRSDNAFLIGSGRGLFGSELTFRFFNGRDLQAGGGAVAASTGRRLRPGVTYDLFIGVDNAPGDGDTLQLHLRSDGDPAFAEFTRVGAGMDYGKDFGARPGTGTYTTFGVSTFNNATPILIDNVHVDLTGVHTRSPLEEAPAPTEPAGAAGDAPPEPE